MEEFINELVKAERLMYMFQDSKGNRIEMMIEDYDVETDDSYIYISGLHGINISILKKPLNGIRYDEECYVFVYSNSEISIVFR